MSRVALATALLAIAVAASSAAEPPIVGEVTPPLGEQLRWHRGEPVPAYEPGKVYVLDFWSTWCPPCYPMIDELSALAREHTDEGLVIVGLAVGTDIGTPLPSFLAKESHRIAYPIAEPIDEASFKAALVHPAFNPLEGFALPYLMIVDRAGRLAWVSEAANPKDGFEAALSAILAGRYDLAAAAERWRQRIAATEAGGDDRARAEALRRAGRWREAGDLLLELSRGDAATYAEPALDHFAALLCRGDVTDAETFGRALLARGLGGRLAELIRLERSITLTPGLETRPLDLARAAVERAQALKAEEDPDLVYELAKIAHLAGDVDQAEALREQAADLARAAGRDEGYIRTLRDTPLASMIRWQSRQFECVSAPSASR